MKVKLLRRVRKTLDIKYFKPKVLVFDKEIHVTEEYDNMYEFLEMVAQRWLGLEAWIRFREKKKGIKLHRKYRELTSKNYENQY